MARERNFENHTCDECRHAVIGSSRCVLGRASGHGVPACAKFGERRQAV